MRKYYLDNLRWLIILILFPYHVLLIYSSIGSYYFHVANSSIANAFLLTFAPGSCNYSLPLQVSPPIIP